jgi:hypothetical protein
MTIKRMTTTESRNERHVMQTLQSILGIIAGQPALR